MKWSDTDVVISYTPPIPGNHEVLFVDLNDLVVALNVTMDFDST
jgi:hypothetical protein